MFCNLDDRALADFEKIGQQQLLLKGAKLFHEDARGDGVYVICTGQVKLSCTSRQGKTLILKIAVPGDVLGLSAAMSGSKYEVTAETVEPTEIKHIRRPEFLAFIEKHAEAGLHTAKALSEQYKAAALSFSFFRRMFEINRSRSVFCVASFIKIDSFQRR